MPVFKYQGRASSGVMKKGTINASSERDAITKLRNKGINPREVTESTSILHKEFTIGSRLKTQSFVVYLRQFSTLIRAGITVVDATNILAHQTESKALKNALFHIEEEVRAGTAFSDAARHHEKLFPPLFINMMRVGEATGNLDATLERLATYYEKQHRLRKSVQSALTYPIVLLILIFGVATGLLLTIVPQFTDMFEDMGAELPLITLFVLGISDVVQSIWWLILLFIIGIPILLRYLYKTNKQFKAGFHYFLFKLPIFGKLLQKSVIAQMTRTLSSLVSSSVPILQALTIVERVVGNPLIGQVILQARDSLEGGNSLSGPLERSWLFPPLVTQMVSIGEKTGQLDYMLEKVADFYEDNVDRSVETLKALIEPLMIVVLAVVVGTIVLAILIPMFSLFEQI